MNDQRFTFLCTKDERIQLTALAKHYHRTQSDTIRMLIRKALLEISNGTMPVPKPHESPNSGEEHK